MPSPPPPPSSDSAAAERPLRRDAERNRRRILEAAISAFAEEGIGVTMDEIARRAGVGVGTVYRRFPEKELLIEALFEDRFRDIVALAEEAARHERAWDGLVFFLERLLELQATDRGFKELMLGTAHGRRRIARVRARIGPILEPLITRAQAEGDLRGDVGLQDMPLVQRMIGAIGDYTYDIEPDLWRRFLAIVLDGLRARREAPTTLPAGPLDDEQLTVAMRRFAPGR